MRSADELSALSGSPRVLQRHDPDALQPSRDGFSWRIMTEAFGRTCIIVVPHTSGMSVHMAVAGQILTSFQFDADTNSIPVDGLFDLGQVILLGPGPMERSSLRERHPEIMEQVKKLMALAQEKP